MKELIQKVKELIAIHPNYGITHALIELVIMVTALLIVPNPHIIALIGAAGAAWWIYRETQGPDQDISWYKRLVASKDRIGDWVSPLIVVIIAVVIGYVR